MIIGGATMIEEKNVRLGGRRRGRSSKKDRFKDKDTRERMW
jgi:hypothetical protein